MKTYTTEIKSLHNLVPVAAKVGVYRPLGEPITISPVKGRLLCAWRDSHVITSAQGGLFAVNIDTAEVSQLAKTTAYCAAGVSDNRIAVMTDAGCQFFSPDGSGELEPESGEQPEWPPISITAEAAAQWRGHTDHDLLAKQAMEIARWYNNALLVIESNTLETADDSSSADSVLQYVAMNYTNVYRRTRSRLGLPQSPGIGFHTNRHTKSLIIDELIRAVREGAYVERDNGACNELATYCRFPNGSYGARRGCHDDILMTRAIALYVMAEQSHLFTAAAASDPLPGLT